MPVEFSVAAYRFGHSLVRPSYRPKQGIEPIALFQQDAANDLRGFRALRLDAEIDWRMFFDEIDGSDFQLARRLDHKLSAPLSELPFGSRRSVPCKSKSEAKLQPQTALGAVGSRSYVRRSAHGGRAAP